MRRKRNYKRKRQPDPRHQNIAVSRFINYVMHAGRKDIAERNVYVAFEIIEKKTKEKPLAVFEKAIENAMPSVEVTTKRVGGANYQVPREVRPERKFVLACRWIIGAARSKKGAPISEKLAEELIAAYKNEGAAIKKKQDTHRMAEANRAFAHFSR